jgi:hypothetical protein
MFHITISKIPAGMASDYYFVTFIDFITMLVLAQRQADGIYFDLSNAVDLDDHDGRAV